MSDLKPDEVQLRWSGERSDDPEAVGELVKAWGGLLREIASEATGDPDAIKWRMGSVRFVCDGCERTRTAESSGWVRIEGLDYCPTCQHPSWKPAPGPEKEKENPPSPPSSHGRRAA